MHFKNKETLQSLLTAWYLVNINCQVGILTIIEFPTLPALYRLGFFFMLVKRHLTRSKLNAVSSQFISFIFSFMTYQPLVGQGLIIIEASR